MYRFLLTPRWLAITLLALLAIPFCVFMGTWQLSRFDARVAADRAAEHAPKPGSQPPIPLRRALPDTGALVTTGTAGRNVTATGQYDSAHQFLVPGRELDGRQGFYVLTMLRVQGGGLAVVRGWLPGNASSPGRIPAAPTGQTTVTGALQASESADSTGANASGGLPTGQLGIISAASLVNLVPYQVYNGWITLDRTTAPLRAVPPTAPQGTGLDMRSFQNLGYTGEWFVFAGFTVFMWVRLVRREAEMQRDLALGLVPDQAGAAPQVSSAAGTSPRTPAPDEAV